MRFASRQDAGRQLGTIPAPTGRGGGLGAGIAARRGRGGRRRWRSGCNGRWTCWWSARSGIRGIVNLPSARWPNRMLSFLTRRPWRRFLRRRPSWTRWWPKKWPACANIVPSFTVPIRRCSGTRAVLLVDDGLATGATAEAAVRSAKRQGACQVTMAAPVASTGAVERLRRVADEVVTLLADPGFEAVGQYYDEFSQTTDEEVIELLHAAALRRG